MVKLYFLNHSTELFMDTKPSCIRWTATPLPGTASTTKPNKEASACQWKYFMNQLCYPGDRQGNLE